MDTNEIDNIIRKYGTKVLLPVREGRADDKHVKAAMFEDEIYINLKDQCLGCGHSADVLYYGLVEQKRNNNPITLETQIAEIETDPLKIHQYLEKTEGYSLKDVVEGKVLHVLDYGIAGTKKDLETELTGDAENIGCHTRAAPIITWIKGVLKPSVVVYHGGVGEDYEYEVKFDGVAG